MDTKLSQQPKITLMSKTGHRLALGFSTAALLSLGCFFAFSTPCLDVLALILSISAVSVLIISSLTSHVVKAIKEAVNPALTSAIQPLTTIIRIYNEGKPSNLASPLAKVPLAVFQI